MFAGGDVINRNYTLSEMPLFVRSGSIIPMRTNDFGRSRYICGNCLFSIAYAFLFVAILLFSEPLGSAQEIPETLKLVVFVGDAQVYAYTIIVAIKITFKILHCPPIIIIVERQSSMRMMVTQPSIWTISIQRQ